MPAYTGTGRTTTYLREQKLQQAAKNNQTITAFFKPKPRAHPSPSPSPEPIISIPEFPLDPVALQSKTSVVSSDLDLSHSPTIIALKVLEESGPLEIGSVCASPTPDSHDAASADLDLEPDDVSGMDNGHDASAVSFLDMTHEDVDDGHTESVLDTIKRLTVDAKKYQSFKSLFHLNALERFVEMWGKYQQNPKIKGPKRKASHAVAVSVGKGQYFARKLCSMYAYVERYQTLPPEGKGQHHAYPTLLNDEQIAAAVRRYLTVLADGEVSINGIRVTKFTHHALRLRHSV